MNTGLTATTVERIRQVLAHYPEVETGVLFGSRAKGTHRPGSDIDLTLCGSGLDHTLLTRIADELDDLLLPYQIDLSLFAAITHPALHDHIRRVGVTLYERSPAAQEIPHKEIEPQMNFQNSANDLVFDERASKFNSKWENENH